MSGTRKTFVFDIDGVIAQITPGNHYPDSKPIQQNVDIVNALYEKGHKIILFTARGGTSGIDWTDLTQHQMNEWGVKHHELRMGKPAADYYIDDKLITLEDLQSKFFG